MNLHDIICARIAQNGPMSLADYMMECLLHPELGYYTTQFPIGSEGDFTTAPEISQMFGELIGLCIAQTWIDQGRPKHFVLAELGPGRGTLMSDALRATQNVPGFHEAADIVLIEASPRLTALQREALEGFSIAHFTDIDALPAAPLFLIANEFFDALPIRQFNRGNKQWSETLIGLQDGNLSLGLGPELPQPMLVHRLSDTKPGDVIENSPTAARIVTAIGQRIAAHGGAALILDYGDWRSLGDTFQAVQNHQSVNPLKDPGCADLTAHVDFETLAKAAPCACTRLAPQGVFLERLGITQRAQTLTPSLSGTGLDNHIKAHRRLTHPDEMGTLFKVMGLYPESSPPPPGLET